MNIFILKIFDNHEILGFSLYYFYISVIQKGKNINYIITFFLIILTYNILIYNILIYYIFGS